MSEKKHGGARPGSGRESLCGAGKTRQAFTSLNDDDIEKARKAGNGSVSAGLRMAIRLLVLPLQ